MNPSIVLVLLLQYLNQLAKFINDTPLFLCYECCVQLELVGVVSATRKKREERVSFV